MVERFFFFGKRLRSGGGLGWREPGSSGRRKLVGGTASALTALRQRRLAAGGAQWNYKP
jgi:hypothetical protein